jgi:hypothetical protein
MRVRGHHLCCVFCYVGSGARTAREYFGVDNAIPRLVAELRADPARAVEVADDFDDVCLICPLKTPAGCGRSDRAHAQNRKLRGWDRAILGRLGVAAGDVLTFEAIVQRIRDHIPDIGEICTNCTSSAPNGFQTFRIGITRGLE